MGLLPPATSLRAGLLGFATRNIARLPPDPTRQSSPRRQRSGWWLCCPLTCGPGSAQRVQGGSGLLREPCGELLLFLLFVV